MAHSLLMVGCGNMGFSMLQAWVKNKDRLALDYHIVETVDALRQRVTALGVAAYGGAQDLPESLSPDIVLFAVKPQVIKSVLPVYQKYAQDSLFVSIIAGTPIADLCAALGKDAKIIRVMPNTPASIGEGMLAFYANDKVSPAHIQETEALLSVSGKVRQVASEDDLDIVTAVSGSGPAYVFYFIECLTQSGIKLGLEPETAQLLAMQTVKGAALLADSAPYSPTELREQVTSPKGTTASGLEVLTAQDGLAPLIEKTVAAAHKRAIELKESEK